MANVINFGGGMNPYPVGSIYLSVTDTDPSELFGGTWERIKGRFLIGAGENDANSNNDWGEYASGTINWPAGETGGSPWHQLTQAELPQGVALTKELSAGDWSLGVWNGDDAKSGGYGAYLQGQYNSPSGGNAVNKIPPYLAVYMWKRTA
ncbi:hypothetical protein FYJ51_01865 [Erysipelotrichaceae bacterium Oil+RF-744-GAM-WT-6]|uniref:Baseplate structural protein Gp10 C-terminal domain-containing protein n=1 Tax=Stecheria intestinalis TaxID=2606630 RepID=A0A7X2NQC4_9FIRM|nr:hypothetical protein [Stecheria intestinalis]MSS57657.1 hypothetical protein [Stecheria intestinalis]